MLSTQSDAQKNDAPLWQSKEYQVFRDRVLQPPYEAKALSATELTSNYKSPSNLFKSSQIVFKFAINGKDNEMPSGKDHHFNCVAEIGGCQTPLIKFGTQLKDDGSKPAALSPASKFTVRLDMREVLSAFKTAGYYTTFNGEKIYKEDFKGIYIAGNSAPLIWDFDNLAKRSDLEMKDPDGDGIYEITLTLNVPDENTQTASQWKMTKDATAFPQYRSGFQMADALYNLSLEEMIKAVEPDSTFRTGKEWAGVWTRDISYSIILSMAYLQPQVAKNSLLRKVSKKKKIIQDTGTGGAWPISTDRMIWAVAAWEVYKVTGDKDWLQEAYTIVKNSVEDDLQNVYDPQTGLVKGESSFLDWREQTYPKWMQPADIFESENLGTNAVHFQANVVLGKMATILGNEQEAKKYDDLSSSIKAGINKHLWNSKQKYYGQYLYGRSYKTLSPRAEALGEALTVIFDIADAARQKEIVANTPITAYGISCIYPQIPDIPPYHNNAVWPFVQTYWLWAGAKTGNEKSVMESISAIYRPAAMFLTNKENFVADDGDFLGTQINSSNMLWSLSGNLSIVHKVFFGIRFHEDGLSFEPFVPQAYAGKRSLMNFKYRDAVLDIEMEGFGNKIKSFVVDGKEQTRPALPAMLTGKHAIKIVLSSSAFPVTAVNKVANYSTLPAPKAIYQANTLTWVLVPKAVQYKVIKNGIDFTTTTKNSLPIKVSGYDEYMIFAIDKKGVGSFASEPVMVLAPSAMQQYELEQFATPSTQAYKGFSGTGFIETNTATNTKIEVPITVSQDGEYVIDCHYANGNGPTNTENKCAIRTVKADNKMAGVFVFPQRGVNEWSNWGYSNQLKVYLTKGKHIISIEYLSSNENMNVGINQAMLDHLRIIQAKQKIIHYSTMLGFEPE